MLIPVNIIGDKVLRAKSGVLDFLSLSRCDSGTPSDHFSETLAACMRTFYDHNEFLKNANGNHSMPLAKAALAETRKTDSGRIETERIAKILEESSIQSSLTHYLRGEGS